jgi:hypothetical protein
MFEQRKVWLLLLWWCGHEAPLLGRVCGMRVNWQEELLKKRHDGRGKVVVLWFELVRNVTLVTSRVMLDDDCCYGSSRLGCYYLLSDSWLQEITLMDYYSMETFREAYCVSVIVLSRDLDLLCVHPQYCSLVVEL